MLARNGFCLGDRSVRLIAGLIVLLTAAACGGGGGGNNVQNNQSGAPTVLTTLPASGATGVALNASVSATFSEAMNNATLTTASFTLATETGGAAVTGTANVSGNTATFTPTSNLADCTQYTATITTAAKDAAGNALAADVTWVFTTVNPAGACYATSFAAPGNPISEGGIWVTGFDTGLDWTNPKTISGNAVASIEPTPTRFSDDIAHLNKSFTDFADDQYAQGTVYLAPGYNGNNGGKHEVELLLRFQITPHGARGYEVLWGITGYIAVVRWNGPVGDYTPLYDPGSGPIPVDGDVLRAEIVGSTISVFINDVFIASASNATWTEGQPGIGFWPVDGAIPENFGWKNFEAGNLP